MKPLIEFVVARSVPQPVERAAVEGDAAHAGWMGSNSSPGLNSMLIRGRELRPIAVPDNVVLLCVDGRNSRRAPGAGMTEVSMHVERVRELAPMVAELRGGFDAAGRLPDALVDELRARKLFRLWLPVSLGGLGLSALEFMDVVEEAASLDGTIGWLVGKRGWHVAGGRVSRSGRGPPDLRRSRCLCRVVHGCTRPR